jgi:alpha,alpha-trehalose phosphorylase
VLKQADVVLALFLLGHHFTSEEKRADFEYYDPLTTGDSTLSNVVQSIIAAEIGYQDLALDYFLHSLFVDLADLHRNTRDGVHVASAGGVWSALASGFGGMRDHDGVLTFDPRLPASWPELRFRLIWHGTRFLVTLRREMMTFTVLEGENPVAFTVRGVPYEVAPGRDVIVYLDDQGPIIEGMPKLSAKARHRREDGSLMVPMVPTITEAIPVIATLPPPDDESSEAGDEALEPPAPDQSMGELDAAVPHEEAGVR